MNPDDAVYDIASLASEANVSARTIRYYEERGLISHLERGRGRRRRYGPDALERLRFIARLKKFGLTLGEIAALNQSFDRGNTPGMLDELEHMLVEHIGRLGQRMRDLEQLEVDLTTYLERIRSKKEMLRTGSLDDAGN